WRAGQRRNGDHACLHGRRDGQDRGEAALSASPAAWAGFHPLPANISRIACVYPGKAPSRVVPVQRRTIMRSWFVLLAAIVAAAGLAADAAQAGKVEVKGVHLCCGQCVKGVAAALKGVDGVTDAKCDQKAKTVTFTTKDVGTTIKAVQALTEAG